MCDKEDSERSGELRLDTSLRVGEEEVEAAVGCRAAVLISESGCGGAGAAAGAAGISAFLAMGQVKLTRASEIEAGLNADLDAEGRKSRRWCIHSQQTARLLYGGR